MVYGLACVRRACPHLEPDRRRHDGGALAAGGGIRRRAAVAVLRGTRAASGPPSSILLVDDDALVTEGTVESWSISAIALPWRPPAPRR